MAKSAQFDKEQYYENVTRQVRWLAIASVLVTFPIEGLTGISVFSLAMIAAIYNLLRYTSWLRQQPIFGSHISMMIVDNLFVVLLLALSGGLASPYFVLFFLTILTAAYWYGLLGMTVAALAQTAVMVLLPSSTVLPADDARIAFVKILSLFMVGFLAERLTVAEREERSLTEALNDEMDIEKQRLATLINSLADAVIAVDPHLRVSLYNGAALELLNTNRQLIGVGIAELLQLEDGKSKSIQIADLISSTKGIYKRDDLLLLSPEDNKINLDLSISPIRQSFGSRVIDSGFILILRDVTKEKSLDQQRDEFISVASHELRTPVAIAEANISTALMPGYTKLAPEAAKLLQQAHQNVVFLGNLIRDLTTISKAEQGLLPVDVTAVDAAALCTQLQTNYASEAAKKGLELKLAVGSTLPTLMTGEYQLHEILQNLITNAIKYTAKGSVTIKAEPSKRHPAGIIFSVSDTGIGISGSDRRKVFEKFYRSEDFRTRQTPGTGLGLYITQKLAERLNAEIGLTSRLNKGSTFTLDVPPFSHLQPEPS